MVWVLVGLFSLAIREFKGIWFESKLKYGKRHPVCNWFVVGGGGGRVEGGVGWGWGWGMEGGAGVGVGSEAGAGAGTLTS